IPLPNLHFNTTAPFVSVHQKLRSMNALAIECLKQVDELEKTTYTHRSYDELDTKMELLNAQCDQLKQGLEAIAENVGGELLKLQKENLEKVAGHCEENFVRFSEQVDSQLLLEQFQGETKIHTDCLKEIQNTFGDIHSKLGRLKEKVAADQAHPRPSDTS